MSENFPKTNHFLEFQCRPAGDKTCNFKQTAGRMKAVEEFRNEIDTSVCPWMILNIISSSILYPNIIAYKM